MCVCDIIREICRARVTTITLFNLNWTDKKSFKANVVCYFLKKHKPSKE